MSSHTALSYCYNVLVLAKFPIDNIIFALSLSFNFLVDR